jgi:hypothetical protein
MHVDYFEILGQALAVDELGNTSIGFYGSSNGVLKLSNSIDDWYAGQGIIASQLGVFPPGMGPNTVAIDELEKHLRTFLNR